MSTWIALLRGINVGGRNVVAMTDLRSLLDELGYTRVRTYIQSGNCVFESDTTDGAHLAAEIASAIGRRFGFEPEAMVMTEEELKQAIDRNPFADRNPNPSHVHFFFLDETVPDADLEGLQAIAKPSEAFALEGQVFYLHAPEGIGRSVLVQRIGRHLPVSMTARNLRTVDKLAEMAS